MPRNSPTGFICAFFATFMGFALIWHIWWLAGLGVVGAYVTFVVFAWRDQDEYVIPADEVASIDRANRAPAVRHWRACRPRNERLSGGRWPRRSDSSSNMRARSGMLGRCPSGSSSATAFGFSCSATSSCSRHSSRRTRCLSNSTAGGPSGRDLFHLGSVGLETACLLLSSFTCGLASIGAQRAQRIVVLWGDGGHLRFGRCIYCPRGARVRGYGREWRTARRAARFCRHSLHWSGATGCM